MQVNDFQNSDSSWQNLFPITWYDNISIFNMEYGYFQFLFYTLIIGEVEL